MSNTTRLIVHLEVKPKGAEMTLKGIEALLRDPEQLQEPDIAEVFDILIEENSIEFTTTQREGYADKNASDIAKFLGTKFPYKITSFSADEITTENVFCIDDKEEFNDWMDDAD